MMFRFDGDGDVVLRPSEAAAVARWLADRPRKSDDDVVDALLGMPCSPAEALCRWVEDTVRVRLDAEASRLCDLIDESAANGGHDWVQLARRVQETLNDRLDDDAAGEDEHFERIGRASGDWDGDRYPPDPEED